ncbi:MAG: hypothetical protein HY897_21675 [Deltaproteobacteria bacterium]|nr:hypothetical protein [Deltaproteobacteria bacterium]
MTRQAKAVISIMEGFPAATQREIIRAVWRRFQDIIDDEEDKALASEARRELRLWKKSGRKTVPASAVRARLEREGLL